MELSHDEINFIVNHLFLPPKLPQADDWDPARENVLLRLVADAARTFTDMVPHDQQPALREVAAALDHLIAMRDANGTVSFDKLLQIMAGLSSAPLGTTIPLHITQQNAGVIISTTTKGILFEAFELSPANEAVMSTEGRLRRTFPGPAVCIPTEVFDDADFQSTIAHALSEMSTQDAIGMAPTVRKSGNDVQEIRDTTHPGVVTELLLGFLHTMSSPVEVQRICKNTREDVLWKSTLLPWRRSPLWLLVRVLIQLQLNRSSASSRIQYLKKRSYKLFMIHILATVLDQCLQQKIKLAADKLHCMIAKLVGRILKLETDKLDDEPGIPFAKQVLQRAKKYLKTRWAGIVQSMGEQLDVDILKSLDFRADTKLHLPKLDAHLERMSARTLADTRIDFHPSPNLLKNSSGKLPQLEFDTKSDYCIHNLHAFEAWVSSNLATWAEDHILHIRTCKSLRLLMHRYHEEASNVYLGKPEGWSVMILTILELWVVCDKSTVTAFPLLADYDPGIPQAHLKWLLLTTKEQMKRLRNLEAYLEARSKRARYGEPGSILTDFGSEMTFAGRYFDQSAEHQKLRQDIENDAILQRRLKLEEWADKQQAYNRHMELHRQLDCNFTQRTDRYGNTWSQHSEPCISCRHLEAANSMKIDVHEWPLPRRAGELKSVIFELNPPQAFCEWRSATMYILLDVLESEYWDTQHPEHKFRLATCQHLSKYYYGGDHRICLLSESKPHIATHRKTLFGQQFPDITEQKLCLNNGLKFQYFDASLEYECFTSAIVSTEAVLQQCTYWLPKASSPLRQFIYRRFEDVDCTPNKVIATQSDCPAHLSLTEYRALASIPVGHRIGWQNILLQIRSPIVDLKKPELSFIVFQTMYQTGPAEASLVHRDGHSILENLEFGHSLLFAIREAVKRIEENWESIHALGVLASIVCRLLSWTSSSALIPESLRLLSELRLIAIKWIHIIKQKHQEARSDAQRAEFRDKIAEVALVCCGTFDVDGEHLDTILVREEGAASVLVYCGMLIYDNYAPTYSETHGNLVAILHQRWQKLSYRAYPLLTSLILDNKRHNCLDKAIELHWPAYESGDAWMLADDSIDYWVSSDSSSRSVRSMRIHYNVMTGSMLVDGLPRSRLPIEYESHSTYRELFGETVFQTRPGYSPGMQFCAAGLHRGYSLQFGLSAPNLMVQATKNGCMIETLPRDLFYGDLPDTFVEDFSHWFDMASGTILLRKRSDPWESSNSTWTLSRDALDWKLEKDGTRLIAHTSKTGKSVARVFGSIQAPLQLNLTVPPGDQMLDIELSGLQQEFCLEQGTSSIISRKLGGFEIDSNQSLGTLVGLKTKLVLKDASTGDRKVLIPSGSVQISKHPKHITVQITSDKGPPFVYRIDQLLQRLTDNGGLQSKLFLCYLHGLTSACLPDPLTCRTGTEQALSILKGAAVKSFPLLTEENLSMLKCIDSLTPGRTYYPHWAKVMQTVKWTPILPFLSQHEHYHFAVVALLEHYNMTRLFQPDAYVQPPTPNALDVSLLRRASSRSSRFRTSGLGDDDSCQTQDAVYSARDDGQSTQRAKEVRLISTTLFQNNGLVRDRPLNKSNLAARILQKFESVGIVCGPSDLGPLLPLMKYNSRWMEDKHSEYWGAMWCRLQSKLKQSTTEPGKFKVMMWFATMAFADKADLDLLYSAAAMYLIPDLRALQLAKRSQFLVGQGYVVDAAALREAISRAYLPFEQCPESSMKMENIDGNTGKQKAKRRRKLHAQNRDEAVMELIKEFPSSIPSHPIEPQGATKLRIGKYIDIERAMLDIKTLFTTWNDNKLFADYIRQFATIMNRQACTITQAPDFDYSAPKFPISRRYRAISSAELFVGAPSEEAIQAPRLDTEKVVAQRPIAVVQPRLEVLIQRLERRSGSKYERQYATELRESADELITNSRGHEYVLKEDRSELQSVLQSHLDRSEQHKILVYKSIVTAIRRGLGEKLFAEDLLQSPQLSSVFLLQQLSMHGCTVGGGWATLPQVWRPWIIEYGKAVAQFQRAKRMLQLLISGKENDLMRELKSEGHTNWDPAQYPEALLLEIENNIAIREVQADIAEQMMNPPESRNAVMQLNMGEGKSSVIVPMVSSALANGSRLARVIVAKPQSRQMFHMLMVTLGGMINRQIFHLPFSRAIKLTTDDALAIADQCRQCQQIGGIMLLQPEHILSFKLMGLETLINGQDSVSRLLLETQHMFDTKSRDIVDESDENFSVKFELIYPLGAQRSIDFAPNRWFLIQAVLEILRGHAREVVESMPESVSFQEGPAGSFPRIRMLKPDATSLMMSKVVMHICSNGLPGFPVSRQLPKIRQAVLRYISQPELSAREVADVEQGPFWSETTKDYLWLLRGLFAKGILAFVYGQKRWRVNYGLDKSRNPPTLLAVPYRAKDSPTPRSEFSHPDVVIALTCNSYYYQGLSDDELFLAFGHMMESDQADAEYEEWKQDSSELPAAFRQLVGVNIKDTTQCKEQVFPSFRYAKRTIDYFLQRYVFPKHMKEFPKKLTASGWDLGAVKTNPTTGFSGTIDSRKVLPLDVSYLDLADQKHTNAHVLECLLRPENGVIILPARTVHEEGSDDVCRRESDAESLLRVILDQNDLNLRVILDVGAQILELDNMEVAQTWLRMAHEHDSSVQAAIYFDFREELMVLDLKGSVSPFQTSPYLDHPERCLVFLDEAHTRGTNLKLPYHYRAAVTLGPHLTKDKLVQACMRMRKLGEGQSVVFCIPHEVEQKILELEAHGSGDDSSSIAGATSIGVLEVLLWSIHETIIDLQKSMPLWATQGQRFDRQEEIWKDSMTHEGIQMTKPQAGRFLEDEAQSLELRYRPHSHNSTSDGVSQVEGSERLRAIKDRCSEVGAPQVNEAALQEEQERELSPEVEEERQIERPPPAEPANHKIHCHLRNFVSAGIAIPKTSRAVMPAFMALADTSAADHVPVDMFPKDVLVTRDFVRTIQKSDTGRFLSDTYQRPVQWILSSQPRDWHKVIIISPFEANALLPLVRESTYATLHLYCARPNQEIRPLDHLDLFSVPSPPTNWSEPFPLRLMVQLNLFAGQLYLGSSAEYAELCKMLRLSNEEATDEVELEADGFIRSATSETALSVIGASTFSKSPVKFLDIFLSKIRKDCQSIGKTHLGKILGGALLKDEDFDQDDKKGNEIVLSIRPKNDPALKSEDADDQSCGDSGKEV